MFFATWVLIAPAPGRSILPYLYHHTLLHIFMYMYKIQSVKLLTVVVDENNYTRLYNHRRSMEASKVKRKSVLLYIFFFSEFPSQQLQQQQQKKKKKKKLTANYVQSRITKIIDPNACTSSCI